MSEQRISIRDAGGRTSTKDDGIGTLQAVADQAREDGAIINLEETTTSGGWVNQDFAQGLAEEAGRAGLTDRVAVATTKEQVKKVFTSVARLTGQKIRVVWEGAELEEEAEEERQEAGEPGQEARQDDEPGQEAREDDEDDDDDEPGQEAREDDEDDDDDQDD